MKQLDELSEEAKGYTQSELKNLKLLRRPIREGGHRSLPVGSRAAESLVIFLNR